MKAKELRQKSESDLRTILGELRSKAEQTRFHKHEKRTKNVRELRMMKKDIARIHTILRAH